MPKMPPPRPPWEKRGVRLEAQLGFCADAWLAQVRAGWAGGGLGSLLSSPRAAGFPGQAAPPAGPQFLC